MYTALITLLLVSLACNLPSLFNRAAESPAASPSATLPPAASPTPVAPTPTPQPLPPALVESDPPPGAEAALNSALTLVFNQPMQRASVESALQIVPPIAGRLEWPDAATLRLQPAEPLPAGAAITLTVGAEAKAENGLALGAPLQVAFQSAGFLRLTQRLPDPGLNDADPSSAIVAAFNRPVVALGADPAELPPAFSLSGQGGAVPAGRGEWLNTSTYIFYPEPPLAGGVSYSVALNPALTSVEGSPLESAEGWSFTTRPPALLSVFPDADTNIVDLDTALRLTFNQPMDPVGTPGFFSLLDPNGNPVDGRFGWSEDFTTLTFTPTNLLQRDALYTVQLTAGAPSGGGTPLTERYLASFRAAPPLLVYGSQPGPGEVKDQFDSVTVFFSTRLADGDLTRYVSFDPPVERLSVWWDSSNMSLNLYGDFAALTDYTLTVSPDLPDAWGETLGAPYRLEFSTAPLNPFIELLNAPDVIFLTGSDVSLSAQAANINDVRIERGSLSVDDLVYADFYSDPNNLPRSSDPTTWVEPLQAPADRAVGVEVFLDPDRRPLTPGLYLLQVDPDKQRLEYSRPYLLVVSDIHLVFKVAPTEALVWAVDLRTQQPVNDLPVSIYFKDGRPPVNAVTDAQGLARVQVEPSKSPYDSVYAVAGEPGQANFSAALSNWDMGAAGWDFGIASDLRGPRTEAYLYTDRPIYRPGQTVYFRAVVRQAFNGRYSAPRLTSLSLVVYDQMGEEIKRFDLPLSAFGSAHGEYTLPDSLQPGYYRIESSDQDVVAAGLGFQVAEYRKPEINLQVAFDRPQAVLSDTLQASIAARYFFDAPAGNVNLTWRLYARPDYFSYQDYRIGAENLDWLDAFRFFRFFDDLGLLVVEGQGQTDPQGRLSLTFPANLRTLEGQADSQLLPQPYERQQLTLEVTATDESGLPVSGRAKVIVNPEAYYIGLRPDNWSVQAGQSAGFQVQVVDWNQAPAGERTLRAEFYRLEWVREDPPADRRYEPPVTRAEYTLLASTDFRTSPSGEARVAFTPDKPGTYLLRVQGGNARSELLVWVNGAGQASWPNLPNQRLRLSVDRDAYAPGDTARLFIPNPFPQTVRALLTLERSVILSQQVLELAPGGMTVELLLDEEFAPTVYASVTLLGRGEGGQPDFRQGFVQINVAPLEQTLKVEVIGEPARLGPGEELTLQLRVTDQAGQPVQGEFSLAVVDLAALALAGPNSLPIVDEFYGVQPLGVRTGLALAAYGRRNAFDPGGMGGGGDGAPPVVRENFPDTAFWNAEIVTGADGLATVSLRLPDNLTTWRVDARGLTTDTRVGQAETDVVTTKDLLVRPAAPRFLVAGDHALLAAVVQNNTAGDLLAEVSLQATGFTLDDPASVLQRVSIPAGGRARLEWWGRAMDTDTVDLIFSAAAGNLQDAARPALGPLPVLRYASPQAFVTAGILGGDPADASRLELVSLPRGAQGGSLSVELAPSLAGALFKALEVLEHYPYECTEQTLARFLPNLETYQALQSLGLDAPELRQRLERTLAEGLDRLAARQNSDGGWSWWAGGESDPQITAYVLFGLSRAVQAGVTVEPGILASAVEYLRASLPAPEAVGELAEGAEWQYDRYTFQAFALAQAGAGEPAWNDALYGVRQRLSPWAQALLANTLIQLEPGSLRAQGLLSGLQSSAIRSASGAHWEEPRGGFRQNLGDTISTSAMVVYVLARQQPTSPLLADAVRYLMAHRLADGAWSSTYASSWTILALAEYMKQSGELAGRFDFSASLNGSPLASGSAGGAAAPPVSAVIPAERLYPGAPNGLRIERQPGAGLLYYQAALRAFLPVENAPPLSRGMNVSRVYTSLAAACPPGGCPPVSAAPAGSLVRVRLTLTLPHDAYYVILEDYFAAGAEVVDSRLKTSQQGLPDEAGGEGLPLGNPFEDGWGWWLFSAPQVYDDHIAWAADYLPAGTYELSYILALTHPGEYRLLPARAWQFYFPDVQGASAGGLFEVGR